MRRIDIILLAIGLFAALIWFLVSGRDGYKGNNALIVARSISINATIEGQVNNNPPVAGTRVSANDLLVRIHNRRIDQSRLVEYETETDYLEREIENTLIQEKIIEALLDEQQDKTAAHSAWMLKDAELHQLEARKQLEIAEKNKQLKADFVARAIKLYKFQHTSSLNLNTAKIEAEIANNQVELNQTVLERSTLLHSALASNGMFFDNGDASYWDKMIDALKLRQIDNSSAAASLRARLLRVRQQAVAESARIGSSINEEHRAPFTGLVSATYVTNSTRVSAGTNLLQVLDCANPIVIVPLPEHRIAEFSVGMKVSVYPVDTQRRLSGYIKYISSGPLMGNDRSLQVQQELTLTGVNAIINLNSQQALMGDDQNCESAHRAVVIIHTDTALNSVSNWIAANF